MHESADIKQESSSVHEQLTAQGFARSLGRRHSESLEVAAPKKIAAEFEHLTEDPYALGSGRYRSYSRMVYLPWRDSLEWLPELEREGGLFSPYDQGRFNNEFQDIRYFPAVGDPIRSSKFFEETVRADLATLSGQEAFRHWPVYIGVHLIRLLVEPGRDKAGTTPDCLHQDGGADMFTFVHLIRLSNATGGDTLIAPPSCVGMSPLEVRHDDRLAHFRLERPLDWYAVNDQMVSHHAAPIHADNPQESATRDVILLGVSPYKPIFF